MNSTRTFVGLAAIALLIGALKPIATLLRAATRSDHTSVALAALVWALELLAAGALTGMLQGPRLARWALPSSVGVLAAPMALGILSAEMALLGSAAFANLALPLVVATGLSVAQGRRSSQWVGVWVGCASGGGLATWVLKDPVLRVLGSLSDARLAFGIGLAALALAGTAALLPLHSSVPKANDRMVPTQPGARLYAVILAGCMMAVLKRSQSGPPEASVGLAFELGALAIQAVALPWAAMRFGPWVSASVAVLFVATGKLADSTSLTYLGATSAMVALPLLMLELAPKHRAGAYLALGLVGQIAGAVVETFAAQR